MIFVVVKIRRRENEKKIPVKFIDRGDEIIVDISELLQLEKSFASVPGFACPFRLSGYDDTVSACFKLNLFETS